MKRIVILTIAAIALTSCGGSVTSYEAANAADSTLQVEIEPVAVTTVPDSLLNL